VYSKAHEGGILYNDPALGIDWQIDTAEILLSEKDAVLPTLEEWSKNSKIYGRKEVRN
jgi:dTDP-4-dehydrorhamnose 3,5-epimerase